MANWNDDIEKYRKGELTPSQMHELERKALNDSFLSDALEGAEQISGEDFSIDVNEINKRITAGKKTVWTPLRIAAGIFLILGVSFVMYYLPNETPAEHLAEKSTPAPATTETRKKTDTIGKPNDNLLTLNDTEKKEKQDQTAVTHPPAVASKGLAFKHNTEKTVDDRFTLSEKKDEADALKAEEEALVMDAKDELKLTSAEPKRSYSLDSASDKINEIAADRELAGAKKLSAPSYSETSRSQRSQLVSGQVTSAEDGTPLPGVNVVIKGTTNGALTDGQGNYSITVPDQKNTQLVFSFIGLQSKEIPLQQDQSPVNVQMNLDRKQLSEVVVTGYGSSSGPTDDPSAHSYRLAEPAGGKRAFKNYLETNLRYPAQALEKKIEGRVIIEFTVKTNGNPTDFNIIKGIGSGCDEEVIRLVKEGPKWAPSKQDDRVIESRMKVNLRFKLPDKK